MSTMTVRPFTEVIGAEISGIDLARPLQDSELDAIKQVWHRHLVLVFRDQALTDPQLERFSARFGALDRKPIYTDEVVDTTTSDYVCVISNVKIEGKPIGDLGDGEAVWHTDMSYNELPPSAAAPLFCANAEVDNDRTAASARPERMRELTKRAYPSRSCEDHFRPTFAIGSAEGRGGAFGVEPRGVFAITASTFTGSDVSTVGAGVGSTWTGSIGGKSLRVCGSGISAALPCIGGAAAAASFE